MCTPISLEFVVADQGHGSCVKTLKLDQTTKVEHQYLPVYLGSGIHLNVIACGLHWLLTHSMNVWEVSSLNPGSHTAWQVLRSLKQTNVPLDKSWGWMQPDSRDWPLGAEKLRHFSSRSFSLARSLSALALTGKVASLQS